jgi:hypothetical protein
VRPRCFEQRVHESIPGIDGDIPYANDFLSIGTLDILSEPVMMPVT